MVTLIIFLVILINCVYLVTGWWFGTFFIFHNIWVWITRHETQVTCGIQLSHRCPGSDVGPLSLANTDKRCVHFSAVHGSGAPVTTGAPARCAPVAAFGGTPPGCWLFCLFVEDRRTPGSYHCEFWPLGIALSPEPFDLPVLLGRHYVIKSLFYQFTWEVFLVFG